MDIKEQVIDIGEITEILPHRYPFLLVDRIIEIEPGKRIVGFKNVTINEPFFQGHFPKHPIMPGVLIIESMAQVGGVLAFKSAKGSEGQLVFFLGIDKAKFRKPVYPGDQLRIEVEVIQERPPFWKLKGMAYVDGKLAAEAELKAMLGQGAKGGIEK
ncbi:MAG: 3-hydroxyacyl-ACP dehydratase FabZ [Nitrospirae bacterium]|nr:3-hydroxyacyl-ACP dehydratase FabZ [Candidatus Manganitrophaceae bacterium]